MVGRLMTEIGPKNGQNSREIDKNWSLNSQFLAKENNPFNFKTFESAIFFRS